jgi:hypothetical protein
MTTVAGRLLLGDVVIEEASVGVSSSQPVRSQFVEPPLSLELELEPYEDRPSPFREYLSDVDLLESKALTEMPPKTCGDGSPNACCI